MTEFIEPEFIKARPNPTLGGRAQKERHQRGFFSYSLSGYIKYLLPGMFAQLFPASTALAAITLVGFLLIVFLPALSERDKVVEAGYKWSWWKLVVGEIFGPLIVSGAIVTVIYVALALMK